MPEEWTGHLIGKMHNYRITNSDLAAELGVTKAYISMIFNGARSPAGARERLEAAVDTIIQRRTDACPNRTQGGARLKHETDWIKRDCPCLHCDYAKLQACQDRPCAMCRAEGEKKEECK